MAAAAAAAAKQRGMQDFVRGLFRGSPDLSILTHAIVRKKYLDRVGQESLSKEEKEQLKLLVEEELLQMKTNDSPGDGELMTETQTSVQSGGHKRPRCTSSSSDNEIKGKQEQKKQCIGKKLEIVSDEDSGIDSKKVPFRGGQKHARKFSSSSEQGDSGAEGHTDGSGSDGQNGKDERNEGQKGSEPTKRQCSTRQRERLGSAKDNSQGQKSVPEETGDRQEVTKGQRTFSESDSEEELNDCRIQKKKGFDKEQKWTDAQGRGKNRKMMDKPRRKPDSESEEESEEEKKRGGSAKAKDRTGRRALKAEVGSESEDASGSDSEQKSRVWGKAAGRKQRLRGVSPEESGSDSGGKRQPREGGMKKTQRRNVGRKELEGKQDEKKRGKPKPKANVSSEESETEPDERKGLKQKERGMRSSGSSEDESQSGAEDAEKGESKSRKVTLSSDKAKNGAEDRKGGNPRKKRVLKKKSKDASGSESSQEEEILKKRGTEKFQTKSLGKMESETDSEDSGDESVGRKRSQSRQKTEKEKPKRRSSKEESGNESVKGEACSSYEDNSSPSKQPHQGKGKEHNSGKSEEHHSIRRLKRYIRECGVHRNYKKLFAGCRSRKAQVEVLKQELENLGLKGAPSLVKCKALKQKREEAAEVASLDISNIIATEGRPRRRNVWSLYSKPPEQPSSPEKPPMLRPATDWSSLRGVISSDGESD